ASDERGQRRDRQSGGSLALERHRMPVECGHDRPGIPWNVEEDRRDPSAVFGPEVERDHERQRKLRWHCDGHRQQKGDRRRRADTGQQSGHGAEEDSEEDDQWKRGRRGDRTQRSRQVRDGIHRFSPPKTRSSIQPTGSSTLSQTSKTRKRIMPMTSPMTSTHTAFSGLSRTPKTRIVVSTEKIAAASAKPMRKIEAANRAKRTIQITTRTSSVPVTGLAATRPLSRENSPITVVQTRTMATATGNVLGPIPSSVSAFGSRKA